MRIVNREKFLSMPAGILFRKHTPSCLDGEICVKHDNIGSNDFFYGVIGDIYAESSDDFSDLTERANRDDTYELRTTSSEVARDGLFDDKQLFAVYSNEDVSQMIQFLKFILITKK